MKFRSNIDVEGNTLNRGIHTVVNPSTTNQFRIDPMDAVGPKLKLGTTSNPTAFWEMGSYDTINNFDNKQRDFKLFNSGNTSAFLMKAVTGFIGLNTSSPTERLHVNGRVRIITVDNATGDFLTISSTGVITKRTLAQMISDLGINRNLQQVTDAGNSTTNPIYFNGNVPLYGQYNSFFAGAEQRPDGQGWLYSAEETNLGVYDSNIGVFVSSIYSRRNIIVPNNFYEYILVVAGGTYWGISFDIVINFGAEGVYLHGKGTAIFNPFNQTVRYKLEWDGALSDPEYYGYEKVRIEFVSDPSGYFYLMAVNDMNDSYTVNITAKVL